MNNLEIFFVKTIIPKYHDDILITCNSYKYNKEGVLNLLEINYLDCKNLLDSLFYYGVISYDFFTTYSDFIFTDYRKIRVYIEMMTDSKFKLFIRLTKKKYTSILSTESILKDSLKNNNLEKEN